MISTSMRVPSLCIENFFDVPEEVIQISNEIDYAKNTYGISPGLRSDVLEDKYPLLCKYITFKVLSQYYDLQRPINIDRTNTHFNKVPYKSGDGIIHTDNNTITVIIYLNKTPLPNSGTSVYKRKTNIITDYSAQSNRVNHFETDTPTQQWIEERDKWNSNFEEVMRVSGGYNTAIAFNGYLPHKMNLEESDEAGERLTLIQFIHEVVAPESPDERFELIRGMNNL